MKKFKNSARRKTNVGLKKIFKTVKDINQKTKKKKFFIFVDIIRCNHKYGSTPIEYKNFLMFKRTEFEKSTFITKRYNNNIIKKYNNFKFIKYLTDPILFNRTFSKYLERKWLDLKITNFSSFKKFCLNYSNVIIKDSNNNVEIIEIKKSKIKSIYQELLNDKTAIIEELINQSKKLNNFYSNTINEIHITTLLGVPIFAYLKTEDLDENDIIAVIDIESGIINHEAFDNKFNKYSNHPVSDKKFIGFSIPKWEKIIKLCEEMSLEIPEISYIEWILCVGDNNKIHLLKAKEPSNEFYQLSIIDDSEIGLVPKINKIEKGEMK